MQLAGVEADNYVARCGGGWRAEVASNGFAPLHYFIDDHDRLSWNDCLWGIIQELLVIAGRGSNAGLWAETARWTGYLSVWNGTIMTSPV